MRSAGFLEHFGELPDPRLDRQKRHDLMDILFIAVCSAICGAKSFVDMEDFGNAKIKWFRERLRLENGIPSHDTFRRVFSLINPDAFRDCFLDWTHAIRENTGGDIIAFDGKTLRRSFDSATSLSAIHVLNAWSSANGFCLGQMKVDGKTNEMKAMPKLLKMIDIKGSVVTADAFNCQKEIAEEIIEAGGDYCLALKGNHPNLFEDMKLYCEQGIEEGFGTKFSFHRDDDTGHGRIEGREYWLVSIEELDWLEQRGQWAGLKSIVCVRSTRCIKDQETTENRYYISSLYSVERAARSIRYHWQVENSLHWVLDMDFGEDDCRARADHSAENFAMLRKIAYNLISQESSKDISIRRKINRAGWDDNYLARIAAAGLPPQFSA
jgi:predicted transposase YbfD/YdcC